MRFANGEKRLEIAASEFARFGELAASPVATAGGRGRAELGREWHDALRKEALREFPVGWLFEHPIKTILSANQWTIACEGRADQIFVPADADAPLLVREIKTVPETLPRPASYWRENRPAFFTQLALYCHALNALPENRRRGVRGSLLLVEAATGETQQVALAEPPEHWLTPRTALIARFAEARWTGRVRLSKIELRPPFENPRPEWTDASQRLAEMPAGTTLVEAPTGFGKTALALVDALRRLRDGEVNRVVYLTGKSSGRLQVFRELETLAPAGTLRSFTLHARAEHAVDGISDDPEDWVPNWRRAGIDPLALYDAGAVTLEDLRTIGKRAGVPPWEITKVMLPFAEFLLCDYNYVFSPWHCGVLAGSLGWEPATTLLVADEAHNLPERAAGARSIHCTATEADDALLALRAAGARGKWPKVWTDWLDFLISLEKHDKVSRYVVEEAAEHCARITRLWNDHPPFHYELETPAMDALERPAQLLPFLVETPPNYHIWSPEDRSLRAACLDASTPTGETLREFHRSILMSATIAPVGEFAESVGLQAPAVLPCLAPWRDVAYDVAVDVRVDTRLREREHHYETTAKTILMFAGVEPCVVFFPSYKYAEDVVPYVKLLDESFRVAIQPRGATPDENNAFISDALITAHAIFLIAGGGLAESIDLLGGKLSRAIVVSPCLPEVNAERAAQMRLRTAGGYRDTFENVYLVPALRKVNQALGRLVRAPGQRAKILLHCKRFASPQVNSLLAPEYRPSQVISTVEDLLNFTNKR